MTLADCYARFRATAYPYKYTVTNQIDPAAIVYLCKIYHRSRYLRAA